MKKKILFNFILCFVLAFLCIGKLYSAKAGYDALDYTFTEYLAKVVYPEYFEDLDPQAEYDSLLQKYLPEMTADGTFMMEYKP